MHECCERFGSEMNIFNPFTSTKVCKGAKNYVTFDLIYHFLSPVYTYKSRKKNIKICVHIEDCIEKIFIIQNYGCNVEENKSA
jgi:hypothetical protein